MLAQLVLGTLIFLKHRLLPPSLLWMSFNEKQASYLTNFPADNHLDTLAEMSKCIVSFAEFELDKETKTTKKTLQEDTESIEKGITEIKGVMNWFKQECQSKCSQLKSNEEMLENVTMSDIEIIEKLSRATISKILDDGKSY